MHHKNKVSKIIYIVADKIFVPIERIIYKFSNRFLTAINRLYRYIYWSARLGGFGEDSIIFDHVIIHRPDKVQIGSRTSLAEFVHIWGGGGIYIGDDVLIASHVVITSQTHKVSKLNLFRETHDEKPIIIGNNVWIGAGAIILPGVRISDGSIIGAGSLVNKDVGPNIVSAGIPSREIRKIN